MQSGPQYKKRRERQDFSKVPWETFPMAPKILLYYGHTARRHSEYCRCCSCLAKTSGSKIMPNE
jgi:hypothetical protein